MSVLARADCSKRSQKRVMGSNSMGWISQRLWSNVPVGGLGRKWRLFVHLARRCPMNRTGESGDFLM